MKYKTKIIVGTVVMLSLLFMPSIARGQSNMDETSTRTNVEETSKEEASSKLQERLKQRKETIKNRINAAEKLTIQTRCKASQAHLRRLNSRIVGISVSRKAVYDNLIRRLTDLGAKLKAKEIDTTEYDKQVAALQIKIDNFYTSLKEYEEAVTDLATMDCAADPEGYKATLEAAKLFRAKVIQAAKEVHTYLHDTIKPTLQTLRQQISDKAQSTGEENQNNGE